MVSSSSPRIFSLISNPLNQDRHGYCSFLVRDIWLVACLFLFSIIIRFSGFVASSVSDHGFLFPFCGAGNASGLFLFLAPTYSFIHSSLNYSSFLNCLVSYKGLPRTLFIKFFHSIILCGARFE